MNPRVVLFSTACLLYCAMLAGGTSLFVANAAVNGPFIGAGFTGSIGSSSNKGEAVVVVKPGNVAMHAVPAQEVHQVVVQQPMQIKPVQSVTLVPVATISSSYTFADKLSNLFGGITGAIIAKTRAVGDFFRSFYNPPRVVLIAVNATTATTTTTTTTTDCETTTKKHLPEIYGVVEVVPQRTIHPVHVDDCDKK